jgi:SAM-dependent methyltransferase
MNRLGLAYFAERYARDPDPWGYATRWYETRKYSLTLAALPRERYQRAFEPGCSIGVLTELLAARCDALVAGDLVPGVAARARARMHGHANVEVMGIAIPDEWPGGTFDLVVLSEVAYYLTRSGVATLLARLDACLTSGAHVVTVNCAGATDAPLAGPEVDMLFAHHDQWTRIVHHVESEFALAVYERA